MGDAEAWARVCDTPDLDDDGSGVRFSVRTREGELPAFVVRHRGRVHAYVNRCAHVPIELDWIEGQFFDDDPRYLVCATHGAMYLTETGKCAGGPCVGRGLIRLEAVERDGGVFVRPPQD